mgnify:CR=1 FL=1
MRDDHPQKHTLPDQQWTSESGPAQVNSQMIMPETRSRYNNLRCGNPAVHSRAVCRPTRELGTGLPEARLSSSNWLISFGLRPRGRQRTANPPCTTAESVKGAKTALLTIDASPPSQPFNSQELFKQSIFGCGADRLRFFVPSSRPIHGGPVKIETHLCADADQDLGSTSRS